ncbi:hypothetical protein RIF23_20010 [Lipingzhangella sp. LS1_29]|uniref:Uncharacterized protein n=1 Tax=Lipingzhangella rawalii TaxID=2055835 RepID=A0ABU2HBA8_9ACTN|nr:hypothetical protein [Lipingzhangella rawalii]MDS1272578.1 hypothetical protein [Lipingzhangella rawalii]
MDTLVGIVVLLVLGPVGLWMLLRPHSYLAALSHRRLEPRSESSPTLTRIMGGVAVVISLVGLSLAVLGPRWDQQRADAEELAEDHWGHRLGDSSSGLRLDDAELRHTPTVPESGLQRIAGYVIVDHDATEPSYLWDPRLGDAPADPATLVFGVSVEPRCRVEFLVAERSDDDATGLHVGAQASPIPDVDGATPPDCDSGSWNRPPELLLFAVAADRDVVEAPVLVDASTGAPIERRDH